MLRQESIISSISRKIASIFSCFDLCLINAPRSIPGGDSRKLAAFLTPGHRQNLAAWRTGGVRTQPGVDAEDMEAMAALGQHPDLIPFHELPQANRTLHWSKLCNSIAVLGVRELGEGLKDPLLETSVGQTPSGSAVVLTSADSTPAAETRTSRHRN